MVADSVMIHARAILDQHLNIRIKPVNLTNGSIQHPASQQ